MASMTREYYPFGHILMHKSTELYYSKFSNRRVFQVLEVKSRNQNF